jgi:hypothetical protein
MTIHQPGADLKRNKIPVVPESSKRTVAGADLTGIGALILAAGASGILIE